MKILRLKAVLARTGLSRATIYRYMNLNEFPQAIKLGLRCVGWAEHEVDAWLLDRMQLRDKALVGLHSR